MQRKNTKATNKEAEHAANIWNMRKNATEILLQKNALHAEEIGNVFLWMCVCESVTRLAIEI